MWEWCGWGVTHWCISSIGKFYLHTFQAHHLIHAVNSTTSIQTLHFVDLDRCMNNINAKITYGKSTVGTDITVKQNRLWKRIWSVDEINNSQNDEKQNFHGSNDKSLIWRDEEKNKTNTKAEDVWNWYHYLLAPPIVIQGCETWPRVDGKGYISRTKIFVTTRVLRESEREIPLVFHSIY